MDPDDTIDTGSFKTELKYIKAAIVRVETYAKEIQSRLEDQYVTKDHLDSEMKRVTRLEKVVYGACAMVLLGFGGAVVALVMK